MNFNEYDVYRNIITRRSGFNPANSERNYSRLVFHFKPGDDWENCTIVTASFFRSAAQIVTSTATINNESEAEFSIPAELLSGHHKKIFVALQGSYTGENDEEITISTNQVCINLVSGIIVEERTSQRLYESLIALLNGRITSFLTAVSNIRSELIGLLNGKIDDDANVIQTEHIQNKAVTGEKLSDEYKAGVTEEIEEAIDDYYDTNIAATLSTQSTALTNHSTRLSTVEQVLSEKLDDSANVIQTNHIKNKAVTGDKLSDEYKAGVTEEIEEAIDDYYDTNIAATLSTQSTALTNHNMRLNTVEQELGNKLDDEAGVIATNHIQNGAVTSDKLSSGFKQYVQNSLNGKVSTSDKMARIEVPASLTTGLDGVTHARFPELDTTNKVLKIPRGMLLIMRNGQNINLAPSGIVPISYSDVTTTTTKVLYNISTNTFRAVSTDDTSSTNNDVLICTIRDSSSYGFADHGMSMLCPHIIDGKLFGVNLTDYIANGSITEAQLSSTYKQGVQNSINGLSASFQNVVNGLSTNINAVKKLSLTNLIKGVTFAFGSVANSTGTETAANNRICSGFIGVSDVRFLDCSITAGYKYAVTCYDAQKTFIAGTLGGLYWRWHSNYHTEECIIPLHPSIKYIRVTVSDTSNSTSITLDDSLKVKMLADYSQYRQFKFLNNYCGKIQESQISHDVWVNGATEGSTFVDGSTRIFSGLIECPKSGTIKIRTATGYQFWCSVFDENWTRVSTSTSWETNSSVEIGNNYKWIVVTVKTTDGSDISPSAGSNCTISYIPTDNVQFVENIATSAATNAVTNAENIQHIEDIISNPCIDISWEYGILWQNAEGDSTTRIRSGYIPVGKGTRVRCATGYQHIVFKFDLQKKWISNPNWTPNEIVVDQDCLIRITVAKSDNSVISESEINTIANTEIIIRQLPQFIADNVLDFSDRIPSYYNTQLKTAINSIINNIVAAGINGESFVFFSDTHWEGNAKWSPALIKEIVKQTNIDTIICGGDLIEGGNKAQMVKTMNDMISRFKGPGKLYVAYGNHDGNTIGSDSAEDHLSKGETYALAQKQSDYNVSYGELCYYYFDNPTTKTRFIVLDTGIDPDAALDSTQRTWFENTLNNMPTGYHALIFAHIIYVSDNWRVGMSALEFNRTTFMDEICTICDTFNSANNGKKVEAMFGGHTHFDLDPTLDPNPDPQSGNRFTSMNGIPIIIIDCDTVTTASADGQGNRDAVLGTITEQCIDIITVDYSAGEINCVRLGRGSNRTISY